MVGDRGLAQAGLLGELGDADRAAAVFGELGEESQAGWVGEHFEELGVAVGFLVGEWAGAQRAAGCRICCWWGVRGDHDSHSLILTGINNSLTFRIDSRRYERWAMSDPVASREPARMSFLDRFLPVWIILAMALGLGLGNWFPGLSGALQGMEVGGISLPIALGLLVMMYPPLAKVRYDKTKEITSDKRLMTVSLILNWVVGPAVMFALAWIFLADEPELRTGLIIVGLARCIAMVLVWSDLSCADREATAVLVAINSVFQVLMFGVLGWFYLQILPNWLGLSTTSVNFSFWAIVTSVLVFLGIPLLAGVLSRIIGEKTKGRNWYEEKFLPAISPLALIGLLYTIVLLFSLQGEQIIARPWTVARVAVPLLIYFVGMFAVGIIASKMSGMGYAQSASVAFTAAGNNFELAIAVAIGTFGAESAQALAGTIGPLIEIPILVGLVYVMRGIGPKMFPGDPTLPNRTTAVSTAA